jgi:type I restriction enzyme S subunit
LKKAAVAPFDGICSGDITVIRAKDDKLFPGLLPFIIQNDDFFDYAVGKSAGSLSPRVKWSHLQNYKFNLPDMDKQMKIAELLWSINDSRLAYRSLLNETDELVRSQFVEIFSSESNYKRLDELCDYFGDGDWVESKDQSDSGVRLIQTGNVGNGIFLDRDEKARFVTEDTFIRLNCTEVLPGDILISRLPDPIGRACIVPDVPKSITAVDCTIVRFNESILPEYFIGMTMTSIYSDQINSFTTGSTRKRVSRSNLGSIMIPVPDIEKQKEFVELSNQCNRSKDILVVSMDNAKAIMNKILAENVNK